MRKVELSGERHTIVDDCDLELVSGFRWHEYAGYARMVGYGNTRSGRRSYRLHRLVLERKLRRPLTRFERVDHVNRDKLDNRRCNLRLATASQNNRNVAGRARLGFKGVYQRGKKFEASISVDRVPVYLGLHETPEEAAWMHDQYALQLHDDFASLNFEYLAIQ